MLSHAEATKRILHENYAHLTDEAARMTTAIQENAQVQLESLRIHPAVAAALQRDERRRYGWVYRFETGEVFEYDVRQKQFVSMEQASED